MFIGPDLHKQYCYATVVDPKGKIISEGRFLNTLEELDQFLQEIEAGSQVVMEASSTWERLYDQGC